MQPNIPYRYLRLATLLARVLPAIAATAVARIPRLAPKPSSCRLLR